MQLGKIPYWSNLTREESDFYNMFLKKSRKWAAWCATKPEKRVGDTPPEPTNEEYLRSGALWWKLFGRDDRVS